MSFALSPSWCALLAAMLAALLTLVWVLGAGAPPLARSRHWALWRFRAGALAVLVAIALNPVRVTVTPGSVHRPEVHVLLDASQSMRLGSPESRWQEGTTLVRDALN